MSALPPPTRQTDTVSTPARPGDSDTVYVQNAMAGTFINDNTRGFYEALPPKYDKSTARFPLLIFLHGGGEVGDGNADLPLILKQAIPKMISRKTFPESFTVSNVKYSFIVVSPQFKKWPSAEDVKSVVDYAVNHYRVDTQRIYVVGMSMGGGTAWEYAASAGNRLAAFVPICGALPPDSLKAKQIAATNIPIWAFHNADDDVVSVTYTTRYVNYIKFFNPGFPVKMTIWPTGRHDAWTRSTDPSYQEDGKNIYEWMLQYVRN